MQIGQGASQYGQGAAPSEIGLSGIMLTKTGIVRVPLQVYDLLRRVQGLVSRQLRRPHSQKRLAADEQEPRLALSPLHRETWVTAASAARC